MKILLSLLTISLATSASADPPPYDPNYDPYACNDQCKAKMDARDARTYRPGSLPEGVYEAIGGKDLGITNLTITLTVKGIGEKQEITWAETVHHGEEADGSTPEGTCEVHETAVVRVKRKDPTDMTMVSKIDTDPDPTKENTCLPPRWYGSGVGTLDGEMGVGVTKGKKGQPIGLAFAVSRNGRITFRKTK